MRYPSRVFVVLIAAVLQVTSAALAASQAARQARSAPARQNPLLRPSTLPFQAPQFDRIQDADFQPAIEEGIRQQRAEILKIANSPAAPTFDNTIVALEKSGQLLSRVYMIFNGLAGANTDDTLTTISASCWLAPACRTPIKRRSRS